MPPGIEDDRDNDDQTGGDPLDRLGGPTWARPASRVAMMRTPKKLLEDRTAATHEAGPANDHSGNRGEFEADSRIGVRGAEAGGVKDRAQAGQKTHQGEHGDFGRTRVDAGQADGLFVGADGNEMTAKNGSRQHDLGCDDDGARNKKGG